MARARVGGGGGFAPPRKFEYFDEKSGILSYIFADLDQFNF
jgi:hypothetical protein